MNWLPFKDSSNAPYQDQCIILHSVMYFLKVKFFIVGIWVGHRIRHAELYLLAENWLLLLTNLLFNDSASMLVFIVMNTGLLIRWSDKCAICLENYAGLKVFLWRIKKRKEPIKCCHLEEKETGKAEGTLQSFLSMVHMQIFGQNSQLVSVLCCAQLKANFRSVLTSSGKQQKEQEHNAFYEQEGCVGAMKSHCKIRWLQSPWALVACLPSFS